MFKTSIKSSTLLIGTWVSFTFTACTENNQGATTTETTAQEQEAGNEGVPSNQEVVQTPDYSSASAPVKEQVGQVLDGYMQLKDALVSSDPGAAQERARSVQEAAAKVDLDNLAGEQRQFAEERLDVIKRSTAIIAGATDVGAQRERLEPLSEAVFALTKAFGASDQTLYYQHCPMALDNTGGYWVSTSSEIRNPYFGESMLTCGSNEEVLN